MSTAVARRATTSRPAEPSQVAPSAADGVRHSALDEATKRWLAEGDTPDNVAAYASALRVLLRAPAT